MNSSFLYHAWGLYSLECTREEYKDNTLNSAVFFLVRKFYMLRCLFGTLYVDMRLSLIHI